MICIPCKMAAADKDYHEYHEFCSGACDCQHEINRTGIIQDGTGTAEQGNEAEASA